VLTRTVTAGGRRRGITRIAQVFRQPPGLVTDEPMILVMSFGGARKTTDLEQERRHTRALRAAAALGDTR